MRIVRYGVDGEEGRVAISTDMGLTWFDAGVDPLDPHPTDDQIDLATVRLLAPVVAPQKVVGVGFNYRDHAAEQGEPLPERPVLFAKFSSSIVGPDAPIEIPDITTQVDYEAELAVVVGKRARRVTETEAVDHLLGYTCLNDVSARDIQFGDGQWTRGKSLDTFCPVGPWIVTPDEIPDPQDLAIRCHVNGQTLQDSSTSNMIFTVAQIVSFASHSFTLEPGDVIATGTPEGVGMSRDPQVYLRPGDKVVIDIERIGRLENRVEAANR